MKYASGLSFGKVCSMDKERIKEALRGRIMAGGNEAGFIYKDATKEEAEEEILSIYDECVYQALVALHSVRALGKVAKDHGFTDNDITEYFHALKETIEPLNYKFENDTEDA